jgi:hypothetical protein
MITMSLALTDEHHDWVQNFTGINSRPPGAAPEATTAPADPSASQPTQTTDPNASQSTAGDPTASQSTAGDPNASQSTAGDPNASQTTADDPSASQSTAGDPNASQSTAGDPNASQSTAGDPNASQSTADDPSAAQTTEATGSGPTASALTSIPALSFSESVPAGKETLGWVELEGELTYTVTFKLAESSSDAAIKIKNGVPSYAAKLKKKLSDDKKVVGGAKVSGAKGALDVALEWEAGKGVTTSIEFTIIEIDAKKAKVKFAAFTWKIESIIADGEWEIEGIKVPYEAKIVGEITLQPDWVAIAKELGKEAVEDAAKDAAAGGGGVALGAILDVAIPGALALCAVATIAGVADAFARHADMKNLQAARGKAEGSFDAGIWDGISGGQSKGGDELYQAGWDMAHKAYLAAVAEVWKKVANDPPPPEDIEAAAQQAAKKAIPAWPGRRKALDDIEDALFNAWVGQNHGYTTFLSHAQDAVRACYGIANEPETGPHISKWAAQSEFMKKMKKVENFL